MFEHDGIAIFDPRTENVYPDDDPVARRLVLGYATACLDAESGRDFVNPFAIGEWAWRGYGEIARLAQDAPDLFGAVMVRRRANLSRCE